MVNKYLVTDRGFDKLHAKIFASELGINLVDKFFNYVKEHAPEYIFQERLENRHGQVRGMWYTLHEFDPNHSRQDPFEWGYSSGIMIDAYNMPDKGRKVMNQFLDDLLKEQ